MHVSGFVVALLLAVGTDPAGVERARALEKQAHSAQRDGRYAAAEKPLLEAIAIWTRLKGPGDVEVLNDEMNLAVSYRRRGDAQLAVPILERVSVSLEKSKDPDAPELHRSALNNLATAYREQNRPAEARSTLERCLAMLEDAPMTAERARVLDNLATGLTDARDPVAAEKYARRSLAVWRALRGEADLDVAIALSNLGAAVMRQGRLEQARPLLEASLRLKEKLLGIEHVEVASVLNLVGELELHSGNPEMARRVWERSLAIARKSLKPGHRIEQDAIGGLKVLEKKPR